MRNFKRALRNVIVGKFLDVVKNLTKKSTKRWNDSIGCLIGRLSGGNHTGCVCLNRLTVFLPVKADLGPGSARVTSLTPKTWFQARP
jgi:hypothetical protein